MVDLYNKGYNCNKVALALKVASTTAVNWSKGGEPGYSRGKALLDLHKEVCG
jgi:hypothetical protein